MDHRLAPLARPSPLEALTNRMGGMAFRLLPALPRPLTHAALRGAQTLFRPARRVVGRLEMWEALYGGARVIWLAPDRRAAGAIVYLHGGAYIGGPGQAQWEWLVEVQRRTGLAAVAILYRMPPDHPFPAALDDAVGAVAAMRQAGELRDGRWVLAGDSAGGGLALAATQRLLGSGRGGPAGLVLSAPWADLAMANPELEASQAVDPLLHRGWLGWAARLYAAGLSLDDPRLSPLNGSFDRFPPIHLNVGSLDLFRPDVRRLRDLLRGAAVEVDYVEQEGGLHTFAFTMGAPEGRRMAALQAAWIRSRLAPPAPPGASAPPPSSPPPAA